MKINSTPRNQLHQSLAKPPAENLAPIGTKIKRFPLAPSVGPGMSAVLQSGPRSCAHLRRSRVYTALSCADRNGRADSAAWPSAPLPSP